MNIPRILTIFILPVITVTASGQKFKKQTVIINDSIVIRGTIIADSSDYLKLRIKTPQVITLKKSQVNTAINPGKISMPDKHGYYLRLSASYLAGHTTSGKEGNMSLQLINGYQFRNGLSVGIGTGIEKLDVSLIPVYADLRYHPFKTRVSPFIWVSSGYGFPCSSRGDENYYPYNSYGDTKGGIMFSAGSGIAIYSWEKCAATMGIGYRYQRIKSEINNIWNNESSRELITGFNRIELQFGIIFM